MEELQKDHTYLIHYGLHKTLFSITILMITEKAYHIRWNTGLTSNDTWELKVRFDDECRLIEDISDFMTKTNVEKTFDIKTKIVPCPSCGGSGNVGDNFSTAGTILCPRCMGNKYIPEVIEINEK